MEELRHHIAELKALAQTQEVRTNNAPSQQTNRATDIEANPREFSEQH